MYCLALDGYPGVSTELIAAALAVGPCSVLWLFTSYMRTTVPIPLRG